MKYIRRANQQRLFNACKGPMITGILGPRRVGKSTLVNNYISQYPKNMIVKLNMDNMAEREKIKAGKLENIILTTTNKHIKPNNCILVTIDEAQKCPELFEQIKILYDRYKDQGALKFIITGSALLELHKLSAESLAGRIKLYNMEAFSLAEATRLQYGIEFNNSIFDLIESNENNKKKWYEYIDYLIPYSKKLHQVLLELLIWGGLPEVLTLNSYYDRTEYIANYLQTYLEKDVHAINSITNLPLYRNLLDITAEQTGSIRDDRRIIQALNCHRDTLIKYKGYLQATLMYKDIYPYINTTLKRLVKSPKGYLVNNGLISYLQGLNNYQILIKTGQIGCRLENWFLNECQVWLSKNPNRSKINYWRTASGVEVDFIVNKPPTIFPFEITYASHIDKKKIRNLLKFREYEPKANLAIYIYMGDFKWDSTNNIVFIPAWAIC